MSNIATPNTPAVDGVAHGLAVAIVEAVQAIAAGLTPEAVQEAAEARARAEGHPTPPKRPQKARCGPASKPWKPSAGRCTPPGKLARPKAKEARHENP